MPRPEKVQAVEEIAQRFEDSEAVFVTEYRGLSVAQQQNLRRSLREAGASYKVVKMSLARLAVAGRPEEPLTEWLVGPTALAFVEDDPVAAAKALTDFASDHEVFVIKGGSLGGEVVAAEMVTTLSKIEPREVLLAKIAGAAKAPLGKFAGMLSSFTRDAASMFSQLLEKKEAEGPVETAAPADEAEAAAPADDAPAASDEPSEEPQTQQDEAGDGEQAAAEEE